MKNLATKNLAEQFSQLPMLKVLVAIIVGILFAEHCSLSLWGLVLGILFLLAGAWWWRKRNLADIYICVATILLAMLSVEIQRTESPGEEPCTYEIVVDALNTQTKGRTYGEGRVVGYYHDNRLMPCEYPVRIAIDSTINIDAGERITAACRINSFREHDEDNYARYMSRRGFVGQVWLSQRNILAQEVVKQGFGRRLHDKALERIARLGLTPEAESVAAAITIGHRLNLTPQQREEYRRSGGAHLLAVSGLHVGFVVVILGILLLPLLLLQHGQLLRNVLTIIFIWVYAAIVGFSPSIVRAATMFSFLQLSTTLVSHTRTLNSLSLAATIMLLWNPFMIHDAGFLLSFLAVAGIVEWGTPLLRHILYTSPEASTNFLANIVSRCGRYILNWFLASVIVSLTASAATMPLVAWLFGLTSLWGIVAGPLMVFLCGIAVGATLLWALFPIDFLSSLFGFVIEHSAAAMNAMAKWCAERPSLIFEQGINGIECGLIYVFYVLLTLYIWAHRKSRP